MMNTVGIVPVNPEILCRGLQIGEAADGLIGIGITLGIGVLRHAPDALDGRILCHQFFHQIHIRAFWGHGHVDHLDAKMLGDGKVPVIAGHRAEELHLIQLAPGSASQYAMGHRPGYGVVHDIQAGIAVHDHLLRCYLHHICHQLFCLRDTVQNAVIAAVQSRFCLQDTLAGEDIHDSHGKVKLCCRRLSSGHIQLQALALGILILLLQLLL